MQIGKSKYLRMKKTAKEKGRMEILASIVLVKAILSSNINDNHGNIYAIIWIKFLHLIAGV